MDFYDIPENNWSVYIIYCHVHILSLVYLTKIHFSKYKNLKHKINPWFFSSVLISILSGGKYLVVFPILSLFLFTINI